MRLRRVQLVEDAGTDLAGGPLARAEHVLPLPAHRDDVDLDVAPSRPPRPDLVGAAIAVGVAKPRAIACMIPK